MKSAIFAMLAAGTIGLAATDTARADHRAPARTSFGLQISGNGFGLAIGNSPYLPYRYYGPVYRAYPGYGPWVYGSPRGYWGRSRFGRGWSGRRRGHSRGHSRGHGRGHSSGHHH